MPAPRYELDRIRPGYWAIKDTHNPSRFVFFDTDYGSGPSQTVMATKARAKAACDLMNGGR